ncbi:glycosyltransferase family 54 protein [Xylona heveae TC161]|uniref:Glycosyltransferase family 54 protein n=1 Tax=Xylona heveae (strain CBS 132557 / TC161) TaxID=1328760 RepID=A0A165HRI2_XYLHT|nr:glycosyltransferase family 54 protein [Xylona heveae TC161]KZF23863.1 glycosyltransferase family 54 protein [Xylona heveae TC161]
MATRSNPTYVFLVFLFLYLLAVQFARIHCKGDPTSWFFDPAEGYRPDYSSLRTEQANAFIDRLPLKPAGSGKPSSKATNDTAQTLSLCVGISSVPRKGVEYLRPLLGSLLGDLTEEERAQIYLVVLIAQTNPHAHPAYSESWLGTLVDQVLLYDLDADQMTHLKKLEEEKGSMREKGLFDYRYLMNACHSVGAPYVAMLEDDTLALDGWFHRTKEALKVAEEKTWAKGAEKWLYLRLFYTEKFHGWNSEEWPIYLFCSIVLVTVLGAVLVSARQYLSFTRQLLGNETIVLLCGISTPLCIVLFFAAGRVTMLPLPAGVNEMPAYGCCSQALVYPQTRVPELLAWYESKKLGLVDTITEEFADRQNEIRWALTPSVMQHVGIKSSKETADEQKAEDDTIPIQTLWSFAFERNDPQYLRIERQNGPDF